MFSTSLENFLPFSSTLKSSSANSFSLEETKICRLRRVKTTYIQILPQVMTDCHAKTDDIKRMEALKIRLEGAVRKCLELDIISSTTSKSTEESDSGLSNFIFSKEGLFHTGSCDTLF